MMGVMPDCKKMSELVSKALEDKPPVFTRMMMAIHLLMCRHCSDSHQQIGLLRDAANAYDEFCSSEDADGRMPAERVQKIKELINCPPSPPTPDQ